MIGIIGDGFVGSAIKKSLNNKNINVISYDKYKGIGNLNHLLKCNIIFFCLPTPFIDNVGYDLSPIEENLLFLSKNSYGGLIVIKSTVSIGTCSQLFKNYNLKICHNPEFLTQRTAYEDFHNQKNIVIGYDQNPIDLKNLIDIYSKYNAKINLCTTKESEATKLFCNSFYAQKVMIFNEFYSLCQKLDINYNCIKRIMLDNDWINPMHTNVPGPDGKIAYGGACFPKDTKALLKQMSDNQSYNEMLEACIKERDKIRKDN